MTTSFHAEGGDTKLWLAVDGRGTNFEEVRRRWAASFAADGHDLYPWGLDLRPIWEVVERIDAAKGQALREHLTLKWQRQARAFRPVNFYTQIPRAVELTGARKRSWGELNGIYTRVAGKLCNGKAVYQQSAGDYVLFRPNGDSGWIVSIDEHATSCEGSGFIHTEGLVCDARPDCGGRWMESEGCAWGETWCDAHGLAVREARCAEVCGAHGTLVANADTCECSCRDGFSGPRCEVSELSPAYSVSGDNADIRTANESTTTDDDDIYAGEFTSNPFSDEEQDSDDSFATVAVGRPIVGYERKVREAVKLVLCALVGLISAYNVFYVMIPLILAYLHPPVPKPLPPARMSDVLGDLLQHIHNRVLCAAARARGAGGR